MATYSQRMKAHLARYKRERLGVEEPGIWKRNSQRYQHILPGALHWLNLHETIRAEFQAYWQGRPPRSELHRDFHHLTSSQAMGFNLLFPWFEPNGPVAALLEALRLTPALVASWGFEHVA